MRPGAYVLLAVGLLGLGCGEDPDRTADGGGGASTGTMTAATTGTATGTPSGTTGGTATGSGTGAGSGSCDPDTLETGMMAEQTGISADIADCSILHWAAQYGEPDPMIIKAMIYGESRFDNLSIGCDNLPCGIPDGWSEPECHCFGMMQIVPACGPIAGEAGFNANGHPNMTTDEGSAEFANSVFNADVNIHIGVAGFAGNRDEVEELFPGCTEDQYTLMALGNLASHGSTTGCTSYNTTYIDYILPAYYEYCTAAGYPPHDYGTPR